MTEEQKEQQPKKKKGKIFGDPVVEKVQDKNGEMSYIEFLGLWDIFPTSLYEEDPVT